MLVARVIGITTLVIGWIPLAYLQAGQPLSGEYIISICLGVIAALIGFMYRELYRRQRENTETLNKMNEKIAKVSTILWGIDGHGGVAAEVRALRAENERLHK